MAKRKSGSDLSAADEHFALTYLANGYNARRAYMAAHPKAKVSTAGVEGHRLLNKPKVASFIAAERKARGQRLQMDGDESLESITRVARADIRDLFHANKLLPLDQWPDDIADAVKSIKPTPFGTVVVLHDKLKARELMAVATGKLRQTIDHKHTFDYAAYLGAEPPPGDDE